jgi:hypothetical protein
VALRRPVPTDDIIREFRKALRSLSAKKKKASLAQQKAIDLEIKLLKYCLHPLEDIWFC